MKWGRISWVVVAIGLTLGSVLCVLRVGYSYCPPASYPLVVGFAVALSGVGFLIVRRLLSWALEKRGAPSRVSLKERRTKETTRIAADGTTTSEREECTKILEVGGQLGVLELVGKFFERRSETERQIERRLSKPDPTGLFRDLVPQAPQTVKDVGELWLEAVKLARAKQYKDALPKYDEALRAKPDFAQAHFNIGVVLDILGRQEQAVESYREALRIRPDHVGAMVNLGVLLATRRQPDFDEAMGWFQKAVGLKPDLPEAWNNMGAGYGERANFGEAIRCYSKALELRPDYAEAWFGMGNARKGKREFEEAIRSYKKAVEVKPGFHKAWTNMGNAYAIKPSPDLDRAICCYKKALDVERNDHHAWHNMGLAYQDKGEFGEAIRCYKKAVAISPGYYQAWYNMGVAYAKDGHPERGMPYWKKVVQLNPEMHEAWYNMGLAYAKKEDFDEAIRCYRKALEVKPDKDEAWYNLAWVYARSGDAGAAVVNLRKAIELNPQCRQEARGDKDFDSVRSNPEFKALVGEGK